MRITALLQLAFAASIVGNAQTLYVSQLYANVGEYDSTTGVPINAKLITASGGSSFVLSGNIFYVANYGAGAISEYNATTGAVINASFITGLNTPDGLAVSGNTLFVSNQNYSSPVMGGTVGAYNATTGAPMNTSFIAGLSLPARLAILGNALLVVNGGTIGAYNITTGALINVHFNTLGDPVGLAISGNTLFVTDYGAGALHGGKVSTYNATTGAVINAGLITGLSGPGGITISGSTLLVASSGPFPPMLNAGTVGEYDSSTGAAINPNFITGLNEPWDVIIAGPAIAQPPTSPSISAVGNGASFAQSFAPGMLMSVFGAGLSSGTPQTVNTAPLPLVSTSSTSVTINGIPAPLLYISATQINLQIPYELSPGPATLTINSGGQTTTTAFTVRAAAPGIFVDSQNGHIVPNESAIAGSTIELFLTGAGQVTPPEATGNVPAQESTPVPNLAVTMSVGGVPVLPAYIGIPDWSVGVLQLNFTVPSTLAGGVYPVLVTIGGAVSQTALLTVIANSVPGIHSLTLSPSSVASGGTATGSVVLSSAALAGGANIALSSSSNAAQVPPAVTVPEGAASATFTVSAGTVSSGQTVTITAFYGGSSAQAILTVIPPANPLCTNVSGNWDASESGSANFSIMAPIESDNFSDPVSGAGPVTITQTGCSIQFEPIPTSALTGTDLTPDQLASLTRTGTVSGNTVSVTGLLALVNTVAQPGLTITKIGSNVMNATGQVSGNVMTLNETGTFNASGTYSLGGQSGSFTLTIMSSSTATFNWASGTRLAGAPGTRIMELRPGPAEDNIPALVRAALERVLIIIGR